MREAKIQCEGVGKTFIQKGNTQVHVLRDVSIDVGRNEFVVILGPGQCGKTTLLRMIAGFEKPSVGRVLMDGREIEGPGHDKGFVFQSYMLFAWRTVRGNVEVGPRVRLALCRFCSRSAVPVRGRLRYGGVQDGRFCPTGVR